VAQLHVGKVLECAALPGRCLRFTAVESSHRAVCLSWRDSLGATFVAMARQRYAFRPGIPFWCCVATACAAGSVTLVRPRVVQAQLGWLDTLLRLTVGEFFPEGPLFHSFGTDRSSLTIPPSSR